MQRLILIAILTLCWFGPAHAVPAEIIQFRMTGYITVDFALGSLPDGISEGAPFEAHLSYDTATPDAEAADPQRGFYQTTVGPNNFLHFRAGAAQVSANDLWLWVGNDVDEVRELWEFQDDAFRMFTSTLSANFTIPPHNYIVYQWLDPTRFALTDDKLPTELSLSDFQNMWIEVTTLSPNRGDAQFTLRGVIEHVSLVPEPSLYPLALSSMLFLTLLGRNRLRH